MVLSGLQDLAAFPIDLFDLLGGSQNVSGAFIEIQSRSHCIFHHTEFCFQKVPHNKGA